ncbi:hypothetical protein LEN26_010655 [Aphanomyces euteiches]|nr:hypothetical protein LEN26_010655 [Aphanomyces euteiches]
MTTPTHSRLVYGNSTPSVRALSPIAGLTSLIFWQKAYSASKTPSKPQQYHHVSSNFLKGLAGIMWRLGGIVQYEVELPKLEQNSKRLLGENLPLSQLTSRQIDKAFQTSRRLFFVSCASFVGLVGQDAVFGYMAYRDDELERARAHLFAGNSAMCYAYMSRYCFLTSKGAIAKAGGSHYAAVACVLLTSLASCDRILED